MGKKLSHLAPDVEDVVGQGKGHAQQGGPGDELQREHASMQEGSPVRPLPNAQQQQQVRSKEQEVAEGQA